MTKLVQLWQTKCKWRGKCKLFLPNWLKKKCFDSTWSARSA